MSDEVVKEENTTMYVHQIDFETLRSILSKANQVNRLYTFNMPNKAISYSNSGFELVQLLNSYIDTDESWRIGREHSIPMSIVEETIKVGEWEIRGTAMVMCIPKINSIIVIPDETSTYRGGKEPTKIIQLVNCISISPLLLRLGDIQDENDPEKYRLSIGYELIVPNANEEPTE